MKAITICQPYAHLIFERKKLIENRNWPTSFRGPLAIHAGKSREWLDPGFDDSGMEIDVSYCLPIDCMSFGAVIATCVLVDCVRIEDLGKKHPHLSGHEHAEGPWCWVIAEVRQIASPIPFKGQLGLFEISDELIRQAA